MVVEFSALTATSLLDATDTLSDYILLDFSLVNETVSFTIVDRFLFTVKLYSFSNYAIKV